MSDSPAAPATERRRFFNKRSGVVILLVLAIAGAAWLLTHRDTSGREAALTNAKNGQFTTAEPALRTAFDHDPDDVEVVEALARGYSEADDIAQAAALLDRWVELKPRDIEPLRVRYAFHRKHRDLERSLADARRMLELEPGDFSLRRTAMNSAFEAGHFPESESYCRECLSSKPGDAGLRAMLANILQAKGDPKGAAAVLDDLLKEDPRNTQTLFTRALIHQELGEAEQAIPLLRDVRERDPRFRRTAGYQLSLALAQTGKLEEAQKVMVEVRRLQDVEVFNKAIESQPDNLDFQVRMAKSLLADGHEADGETMLKNVLQRDPGFRPAHRALAELYDKKGESIRAAEHRRLAGPP